MAVSVELHHIAEAISASHDLPVGLATKQDIQQLQVTIMAKLEELIAASSALSTASDGLSVKLDTLVDKIDAVVVALQNADLPPAGEAALAALKSSATTAAVAGDAVDAKVAELDTVLPVPAPAGPGG